MRTVVPCGACTALVPVDTGCEHWRPGRANRSARAREHRRRTDEALAELRRQLRVGQT